MGKIILNSVEYVGGDSPAIVDVNELPTNNISKDTFYRKSEDVYIYQRQVLDTSTTVWYGDGPNGFIEVIDEGQFIAFNVVGDIEGVYPFDAITAQDVNSLLDAGIIEVKSTLDESKIFGSSEFFGASELVTVEKGAYKLYHNPTARPGGYIEVGEGSLVTSISSSSTDNEYPSAKCMWDIIGDVETLINAL